MSLNINGRLAPKGTIHLTTLNPLLLTPGMAFPRFSSTATNDSNSSYVIDKTSYGAKRIGGSSTQNLFPLSGISGGKHYFEFKIRSITDDSYLGYSLIVPNRSDYRTGNPGVSGDIPGATIYVRSDGTLYANRNSTGKLFSSGLKAGDILGFAFDLTNHIGLFNINLNGTWGNLSGQPITITDVSQSTRKIDEISVYASSPTWTPFMGSDSKPGLDVLLNGGQLGLVSLPDGFSGLGSPTNFVTLNAGYQAENITPTSVKMNIVNGRGYCRSGLPLPTGSKYYFEVTTTKLNTDSRVGLRNYRQDDEANFGDTSQLHEDGYELSSGKWYHGAASTSSFFSSSSVGSPTIIGMALDTTDTLNPLLWIRTSSGWHDGNPANNTPAARNPYADVDGISAYIGISDTNTSATDMATWSVNGGDNSWAFGIPSGFTSLNLAMADYFNA